MNQESSTGYNHIRQKGILEKYPISRSTLWRLQKEDPTFPKFKRLGSKIKIWKISELDKFFSPEA